MSLRAERIQKAILQILSPAVRELKDPEIAGFITITEVKCSKDVKLATVYFSVMGTDEEKQGTERALNRAAGFCRHLIAQELTTRTVPEVRFKYDPTPERADRIERILNQLEQERHQDDKGPEEKA